MRNVAKCAPLLLLIPAFLVSTAAAQPGDYRRAKKAAKLAVKNLSVVQRASSRVQGAQAEKLRQVTSRMGLPDQDLDGVPDIFEQLDGTDACNAMSDGQHRDGSLRKREGAIVDMSDFSITVDDVDFVLDGSTQYFGLTQDDLDIDVCVEVTGFEDGSGDIVADSVSASDSCDDSSEGEDGRFNRSPFSGGRGGDRP